MISNTDRILLVENDRQIGDLIARQALLSVGLHVEIAGDVPTALRYAVESPPDLIIADLNLPGLSAKDLLVALASQGVTTPMLVLAARGQEQAIIQAFRLGAADYIFWPASDAEVVSVVERVLARARRVQDSGQLDLQLRETNQELQSRIRELTAIINIGKAVISLTDQRLLFQEILDGAVEVAEADIAWLLVRDEETRAFILIAERGLPITWASRMNLPLDDGISGLVALSGRTLSVSGEPLLKFRAANLGKSVCAVPIKVQREIIGLLVVVRRELQPFAQGEQSLLEAVADYASISLVNARLFRALKDSAEASKLAQRRQNMLLESIRSSVNDELRSALHPIELLLTEKHGRLTETQRQALQASRAALQRLARAAEKTTPPIPVRLQRR